MKIVNDRKKLNLNNEVIIVFLESIFQKKQICVFRVFILL